MRLWDLGIGDWEDWGSGDSGGWKDQGIGGSEGSRGGGWGDQRDWVDRGIGDQGSGIFALLIQLSFSQKLTNGGLGDWGSGDQGTRDQDIYVASTAIFFTETYQILTREMTDVATEVYNFNYYANNSFFHTYGNVYNTYSYYTEQDFKRTLDYIAFRKPRMQDNLNIKVLDWR